MQDKLKYRLQMIYLTTVGCISILAVLLSQLSPIFGDLNFDYSALTVVALGSICLSLVADRHYLNRRLEDKTSRSVLQIRTLPEDRRGEIHTSLKDLVELQHLQLEAQRQGNAFGRISGRVLEEQQRLLRGLAKGRLMVPHEQTAIYQRQILGHYHERFDAVSNHDLDFWTKLEPLAQDYCNDLRAMALRGNGSVTRILILSISDLSAHLDEVAKVATWHHRSEKGFAIAISDLFSPPELKQSGVVLDFALFDRDQAVSYFSNKTRSQGEWRFGVSFGVTPENRAEISKRRKTYIYLLGECWLVNSHFLRAFPELSPSPPPERSKGQPMLDPAEVDVLRGQTKKYNDRLHQRSGIKPDPASSPFPFLMNSEESCGEKLRELLKVLKPYGNFE